jgi:hypothetical protein
MGFLDSFYSKDLNQTRSEKMYNDALQLFNSPELQNARLPRNLADKVINGEDCDVITGAAGAFGHDMTNPIPVNGPLGEVTYLSRLRLRATGSMVFFHKINTVGAIDLFELVNVSGKFVDYLYLDMFHPRCSRLYPAQYTLEREAVFPRGVTAKVEEFPKGLYKLIKKESEQHLGVDVAEKESKRIDVEQAWQSIRAAK